MMLQLTPSRPEYCINEEQTLNLIVECTNNSVWSENLSHLYTEGLCIFTSQVEDCFQLPKELRMIVSTCTCIYM